MSKAAFDAKFGAELVSLAPTDPGVYRYTGTSGVVLYVGKAKNLRRRLATYRNATRKRAHRKMRILVREAGSLAYETCESEQAALLRESELIRQLKPPYNVDGAFAFLYPSLGIGQWDKHTLLCFTTYPERFEHLGLSWYGCFRSRPRVKLAFEALIELLRFVAHREKSSRLPDYPRIKGSRVVGLRQVPPDLVASLGALLSGQDMDLPRKLARMLLTKPSAVQRAAEVQTHLDAVARFYEADALRLREALQLVSRPYCHVAQDERDTLFIRAAARARFGADADGGSGA